MAKTFKIPYKTRNKLQRAIQQDIRRKGLVQEGTMLNSVRVSSATGDLNKLYITINAIYYYMFLDKGTRRSDQAGIAPQRITSDALKSPLGREFQQECVDLYMAWMIDNYPILDVGKILVDNLKVELEYQLYGDDTGEWNGTFKA
jgi:hypothetical protein